MWQEVTLEERLSFGKEGQEIGQRGKKQEEPSVKAKEINALSRDNEEGRILLNLGLELSQLVTTNDNAVQDWIMDSGASFHVTPHCQWFTSYDAKRIGRVNLGNDFVCAIKGVGDVKLKF